MKKVLNLTLKKEWFDKIVSGEKTEEYREIKPYWTNRFKSGPGILSSEFDEVHFRNGYNHDSPFMRVECENIYTDFKYLDDKYQWVYVISLGKILEIKNHHKLINGGNKNDGNKR